MLCWTHLWVEQKVCRAATPGRWCHTKPGTGLSALCDITMGRFWGFFFCFFLSLLDTLGLFRSTQQIGMLIFIVLNHFRHNQMIKDWLEMFRQAFQSFQTFFCRQKNSLFVSFPSHIRMCLAFYHSVLIKLCLDCPSFLAKGKYSFYVCALRRNN